MSETISRWELTGTDPGLSREIEEALRQIVDPELGLNLIELGLIREVKKEENALLLTMILTTPFCPYGPMLIDETRLAAENAVSLDVTVEMGTEMWDARMMEDGLAAEWGLL